MMQLMHVNVACSDFDRSYDFYTAKVGMKPLTSAVLKTGSESDQGNRSRIRSNGHRIGEARTGGEAIDIARALGFDGNTENRAALLYWGPRYRGPYLELQEWQSGSGNPITRKVTDPGISRVAMFVDDIDADVERLSDAGIEFLSPVMSVTAGVTLLKIVCFLDPDGTLLELVEIGEGAWE
jgi:catechol 2,3-dioxygenase-like lactoylglutathione lyase family enzyme